MWKPNASPDQSSPNQPLVTGNAARPNRGTFPRVQPEALIGKSICVKGEITGAESLRIDGRVEGKVHLPDNALYIGREASVTSEITAGDLVVCGRLQGNSTIGHRLEIRDGGSLTGSVSTARISIEEGAHFKGKIEMRPAAAKSNGEASQPLETPGPLPARAN